MSATRKPGNPATPTLYRPHEIAKVLHCSEWWVKEQARKRRIPFTWIGGSYRFTQDHLVEIIRLFEVRPASGALPTGPVTGTSRRRPPQLVPPAVRLTARTPGRTLKRGSQSSSAA